MAVLVAFVLAWETLALDDALDVLDAMLAVIIRDARKIGQKKRLRSLKDLDKSALALASMFVPAERRNTGQIDSC